MCVLQKRMRYIPVAKYNRFVFFVITKQDAMSANEQVDGQWFSQLRFQRDVLADDQGGGKWFSQIRFQDGRETDTGWQNILEEVPRYDKAEEYKSWSFAGYTDPKSKKIFQG